MRFTASVPNNSRRALRELCAPLVGCALVVALSMGCDGEVLPPVDAGVEDCSGGRFVGEQPCTEDRNCGGGICDKTNDNDDIPAAEDATGCCLKLICTSNADCNDTEKCDIRREICVPKNLCDPAGENGGRCEQDDGTLADCCQAGQLCQYTDGQPVCVDEAPAAASCFVSAGGRPIATAAGDTEAFPAVTSAGQDIQLEAIGEDANGKVIPHAVFTWAGGANANGVLTAPVCAAGVCDVTVTATANGGATCDGLVRVYAAPTLANRIVVIDIGTGEPLEGVEVAAGNAGVVTTATTDENGAAEFDAAADSISAFPDTHQWHSILSPPSDVIIYTAKLPDPDVVAGVKGVFDFDSVHTQGEIKLGLSGAAISSSITDLDFTTLIGDLATYNVEIETITPVGGQEVPLPSGLVIELGTEKIKGEFVTFGEPGRNILWAIGGKVGITEVGPIISGVAGGDVNVGSILGGVLPFFATFDHASISGLDLVETARPPEPANDAPVPFDEWDFEERTLVPNTLLALSAGYTMPDLPCAPGARTAGGCVSQVADASAFATGAVLLTGVVVPGVGLVPLGLTAGLDDPKGDASQIDGKLDYDGPNTAESGTAIIDYAPPHDGLEGNLFVSVAIALDINAISDTSGSFGASIITHVANRFDPDDNSFPQAFLESQGGTFTPGAAGSFVLAPTGDADFWRANFDDGNNVEWNVWFADAAAQFEPGDLHPNAAEAAARFTRADVQAFKLGTGYEAIGPAPADFDALFAFDGVNIDNLLYYLGAWSSEACKFEGHCVDTAASPPEE